MRLGRPGLVSPDGAEDVASGDGTDAREVEREDPVYEAAAGWVARVSSPDATEADRGAFETWHAADPAHAEAYAEMEALWQTLGHVPDRRHRRSVPKGLVGVAAAIVLCAALAFQLGLVDRLRSDLWSGVGDITHATLADGSRIDLNTDTAIALHFNETERGIELLRGEAFFDVVPDPRRPFVVRSGGLSVRAVGTRFFVRAGDTDKPAGVVEGSVDVAASGRPVRVSAGEALHQTNGAPCLSRGPTWIGRRRGGRDASSSPASACPRSWPNSTVIAAGASCSWTPRPANGASPGRSTLGTRTRPSTPSPPAWAWASPACRPSSFSSDRRAGIPEESFAGDVRR